MQVKNLEVNEIILTKIDSRSRKLFLQVNFTNDSSLPMEITLEEDFEASIDKLIKQIKSIKKPSNNNSEDDFLSNISIVNLKNEEDIKERAPKRLYMLDRKLDTFKQIRNYKEYMNMYSQFSTHQETIYQKSNNQ